MQPSMLSEHESANKPTTAGEETYNPSIEERKLVKKMESLFMKAKKKKSKFDYCWPDYYKMFRGKQWKEQRPSYRNSEVFNLVFQAVQSQVPLITDSKPKFEYLPTEPSDREFADLMNDIAASDWQRHNWLFVLTEVVYDSYLYGTGLSSLTFDADKNESVVHWAIQRGLQAQKAL